MRFEYCMLLALLINGPWLMADQQPGLVGPFGNFERYEIVGSEFYSADELKSALQNDVELLPHSRPGKNLNELLQRVAGALLAGYHKAGFAEIGIFTTWDEQLNRPVITVTEGPKFLCGEIKVEGVPRQIAESIQNWLVEKHPPLDAVASLSIGDSIDSEVVWRDQKGVITKFEKPAWVEEQECNFHRSRIAQFEALIERALQDHGYLKPKFEVRLLTDLDQNRADLLVQINSSGEVWTIDEIKIEGLKRHQPEQIIEFLKLRTGASVTAKLLLETQWKLQQSGRFRWSQVHVEPKLIPTFPTVLSIQLLEAEYQPTLGDEFTEQQSTVLRMCDWINRFEEQENDLVIDVSGVFEQFYDAETIRWKVTHSQICLSPLGDTLLCVDLLDQKTGVTEKFIVCVTNERTVLILEKRKLKYTFTPQKRQFPMWNLNFAGLPPSSERNVNFYLGFGASSDYQPVTLTITPFAALYNFELFHKNVVENDDELSLAGDTYDCRIDRQSGRLKNLALHANLEEGKPDVNVNFRTVQGEFARLVEQHIDPNPKDKHSLREVDSLVEFVVVAVAEQGDSPEALQTAQVSMKLLKSLIPPASTTVKSEKLKFTIPPSELTNSGVYGIATLLYAASHHLLADGTPLWQFARELIAAVALKDRAAGPHLVSILQNRQNGTIVNWLFSEVTAHIKIVPSEKLAGLALEQLETQNYRSDLKQLFDSRGALGASLFEIVKNFRELTPEETRQLLIFLPPFHLSAVESLQENEDISDDQFVSQIFDLIWHAALKEKLRLRLQLLHEDAETHKLQLNRN